MKRVSVLFSLLLCTFHFACNAQGFSQLSQTPLLNNPSFAGSTGGGRLSFASNLTRSDNLFKSTYTNSFLSYDDLWKKKGLGWGISFSNKNRSGFNNVTADENGNYNLGTYTYKGSTELKDYSNFDIGMYISPKYALKNRNGETTWTLSPSLGFNYAHSNYQRETSSYINHPYYKKIPYAYEMHGNWDFRPNNNHFKSTVGLMLNSKNTFLGIAYSHSILSSAYHVNVYLKADSAITTYNLASYEKIDLYKTKRTVSHGNFSFIVGKSFTIIEKSQFSITPIFQLNIGTYYGQNPDYTGTLLYPAGMAFNLTATWNRFYSGFSVTSATPTSRNLFVGYKTDDFRLGLAYGFGKELLNKQQGGLYNTKFFGEVSFTYYFKSKKEYRKF